MIIDFVAAVLRFLFAWFNIVMACSGDLMSIVETFVTVVLPAMSSCFISYFVLGSILGFKDQLLPHCKFQ